MKRSHIKNLSCQALLIAMCFIVLPMTVYAAAGKVEFASGGAALQSADGSSKALVKGMDVNAGDTILTGSGRAQVKFTDGGYMSFQPDTQFKVEEYHFNGKQDGSEKGFFRLIKGGLRAVTGLVGRENRPAYRVATPVATIGIRGTYFLAEFRDKLKTHCGHGSIYVFNEQGDIILFEGQSAEVEAGGAPTYSDEQLTLGARGPEGGEPASGSQQLSIEAMNRSIFKAAEQYASDGVSCGLTGGCAISGVMANLNGINAQAYYTIDPTVANVGGGAGWDTKISSTLLHADFGTYTMSGSVNIASTVASTVDATIANNINTYSSTNNFNVSGSILPSGVFGLTGSDADSGICPSSGCTLNMIGVFAGPQADKAGVNYVIKGVNSATIAGAVGNVTGSAGLTTTMP